MISVRNLIPLTAALAGFGVFAGIGMSLPAARASRPIESYDRIVVSAPVQLLMASGDRFLAANFESIRAAATTVDTPDAADDNASLTLRARRVVSQLNPCHEDNYYQANAFLTWGGAVEEGNEILRKATDCRTWDELPPFYYGFSQYFFLQDFAEAQQALDKAANRATANRAFFRRLAVMIAARELKDDNAALAFLQHEREQADDPKLQSMLDQRIGRLQGLIALRAAQQRYEARFGQPLSDPQALVESGELAALPDDPLRIGYEFADGHFRLRELKIAGLKRQAQ